MTDKRKRAEDKGSDSDDMEAEFDDDKSSSDASNASPGLSAEDDTITKAKTSTKYHFSPELLAQYYSRLFPFHLIHSWLSYDTSSCMPAKSGVKKNASKNDVFSHREFSFTIEPTPGEEIYMRYKSFANQAEFSSEVLKKNPHKIDIGAVFSHPPKDHKTIQGSSQRKFRPSQRELVFDVDLTDYDCVRKCGCSGAKICLKCWKMMSMAMKVMDTGLKEDFGFQNIAWFYSGRRGVHAWVCDESARQLSDPGRSAVASYFEVNLGTEKNQNVDLRSPLHPTLQRAFTILEPMFVSDIIPSSGHGILAAEEHWTELLKTLPPAASAVKGTLTKKWAKDGSRTSPIEKWDEVKRYLDILIGKNKKEKRTKQAKNMTVVDKIKIEQWPIATVFRYTYPRLDINVSKMQNHLLKSPFCVHPKTGRVCIPINIKKVDSFNPFDVPTLPQLMGELDAYQEKDGEKIEHEWEKTSLKESFGHFQKEFLGPMWRDLKRAEREVSDQRAAMEVDF